MRKNSSTSVDLIVHLFIFFLCLKPGQYIDRSFAKNTVKYIAPVLFKNQEYPND